MNCYDIYKKSYKIGEMEIIMQKMKGTKCEFGYIKQQKIFQSLMLLLFVAIGVGLFLTGLLITKTRANVFTVLGILMVLPAAKRMIALVILLPRKSVTSDRYEHMRKEIAEDGVLFTDYVFTSTDKVMSLDFLVIQNKNILGILGDHKQDQKYIVDYLQKSADDTASGYRVRLFQSDEEFFAFYSRMNAGNKEVQRDDEFAVSQNKVAEYLKILAV